MEATEPRRQHTGPWPDPHCGPCQTFMLLLGKLTVRLCARPCLVPSVLLWDPIAAPQAEPMTCLHSFHKPFSCVMSARGNVRKTVFKNLPPRTKGRCVSMCAFRNLRLRQVTQSWEAPSSSRKWRVDRPWPHPREGSELRSQGAPVKDPVKGCWVTKRDSTTLVFRSFLGNLQSSLHYRIR